MSQTSYSINMQQAYEGSHGTIDRVRPGRNNQAVVQPVGRMVAHDTATGVGGVAGAELAFRALSAGTDVLLGVLIQDHTHPQATPIANGGVPSNAMASIVSQGEVWVQVEQAVTPSSPVFARFNAAGATGTNPAVGRFRIDADTARAVAVPNARFLTSAAAGGLALLELNLP